jgi:hypothetical protein
MTNLVPWISIWMLLAVFVLALALYRKFVSAHEEDRYVHISEGEARSIPHQIAINHKLEKIDRWGEALTIATLVAGVVLAAVYLYFRL